MKERKLDKSKLTNPLTCVKCGRAIERGALLAWNRRGETINRFWHAEKCPTEAKS